MSKKTTLMKGFNNLLKSTESPTAEPTPEQKSNPKTNNKLSVIDAQTSKSSDAQTSKSSDAQTSKSSDAQTSKSSDAQTSKSSDAQTSKSSDAQTSKSSDAQESGLEPTKSKAKYINMKKCTLYLPQDIMDNLAIEKVKSKRDLSELTADALTEYLSKLGY